MGDLKIYTDLEQGSDEWLEARRGIVTASEIHKLFTGTGKPANNQTSRGYIAQLAAERISGHVEPFFGTWDMDRGETEEVYARQAYEEYHAPVEEVGFMVRNLGDGVLLGYSPDGLVGDDGGIEIKSRKARIQVDTILYGGAQMAADQMNAGMIVADRDWIDYCSYSNGMPFWVERVNRPDPETVQLMIDVVKDAEIAIRNLITNFESRAQGLPVMEWRDYDQELEIF